MNLKIKKRLKEKAISRDLASKRLLFISACICGVFLFFSVRLFYIMIYKNEEYSKKAQSQREAQYIVLADRGDILARNGAVLASTINVYRIDLDLAVIRKEVEDGKENMKEIAKSLSDALEMDYKAVMDKLQLKTEDGEDAQSAILIRGIEKKQADKVEALDIYGVIISNDTKRLYPNNNYLAHELGSVNLDNQGLNGVELQYDKYLAGIAGIRISEVDAASRQLPNDSKVVTPPIPGKDVTLTIDENIQHVVDELADKALKENKAKGVSIIVTNPNSGEILAMTNKPDFNPNNSLNEYEFFPGENDSEKLQNMFKDSIVSDTYEPGSTFKNFSMMAALEEGVVSENDTFICNGGTKFGSTLVKCWNTSGHGKQTLPQILQNSCNVGFMAIGEKLGAEKLNEYLHKYGFGETTNIDLPGEAVGILKKPQDTSEMDLATIAFGQTNTSTALQLISGFNAIANGGDLIQPHIMKEISHLDENGTRIIDEEFKPTIKKDVMSDANTGVLREYLERTINEGGPVGAFMGKEYRVAGKTGTAEKADPINGGYANGKYIASVLAMYPVTNPELTIYIKVDEPNGKNYYGGPVTSPITKEFFTKVAPYLESPIYKKTTDIAKDVMVPDVRGKAIKDARQILLDNKLQVTLEGKDSIVTSMNPNPGEVVKQNSKVSITSGKKGTVENKIIMPDLTGFNLERVDEALNKLGITYNATGTGKVTSQSIEKGHAIEKGTKIQLELKDIKH